ncbi:hypothetical protein MP213Fo_29160 [Pseudochrobactrum sp. MP213Fo]
MNTTYDAYNLAPVPVSVKAKKPVNRKPATKAKPTPYPAHPLADLFPMIAEAERTMLADDITAHGQHEPILLLEGMVLDGRNRQWACIHAGIKPVYEDYSGTDPLNFVLSKNLHRRHLTESQRALVAASIVDWERGVNQNTAGAANLQTRTAAAKLSISERAVHSAKRIHEHGSPELLAAIREGRVSVHAGEALSELQHSEQCKVLRQEQKQIVAKAKEIRTEKQKLKHTVRLAHMAIVASAGKATAPDQLLRRYPVFYADPPWKFGVRSEQTGGDRSAENHYPTMETDKICQLMATLGNPVADDAVLFLWATNPMLPQALQVMEAWGFQYVHHWIWDKAVAGTGYWGRDRHELLLIGRRGDVVAPLPGTQPETVHSEKKGRHSAKPAFFAEEIEKLYPGVPRLEMFCRTPRDGWDAWGYEAGGAS